MTQSELAHTAGVSRVTVSRAERGCGTPDTATIRRLAAALQGSAADIFPPLFRV